MHSGQWKDRGRMAWYTWYLGGGLILSGTIGIFTGHETLGLITNGVALVTLVKGIMVAGKVHHDISKGDK